MQGSQCLGSARAAAPAWEWGGTPGRLAKMPPKTVICNVLFMRSG